MSIVQTGRGQAFAASRIRNCVRRTLSKADAWISDYFNERRMQRASREFFYASQRGDKSAQRLAWERYRAFHFKRSSDCIVRLEAKFAPRLQRGLKESLMTAFFKGTAAMSKPIRIFGPKEV